MQRGIDKEDLHEKLWCKLRIKFNTGFDVLIQMNFTFDDDQCAEAVIGQALYSTTKDIDYVLCVVRSRAEREYASRSSETFEGTSYFRGEDDWDCDQQCW